MNELAKLNNESATMSSLEIAELTNKNHNNVLRDIRTQLLKGLYNLEDESKMIYEEIQGVTIVIDDHTKRTKEIILDKYHTDILVSGYEVKYRAAIIKRWQELELRTSNPYINMSKKELHLLAIEYEEKLQELKDNNVMFPKKVLVDKEKITLSDIKALYPFLQIKHIQIILNYYSTEKVKLKNNHFFVKEQVEDYMAQFISTVESEVVSEKNILLSHECLFDIKLYVKKKYAIEYFGYFEENFEV